MGKICLDYVLSSMVRVTDGTLAETHCGYFAGDFDSRDSEVGAHTGVALSTGGHRLSRRPLSVGTTLERGTGDAVPATLRIARPSQSTRVT